MIYVKVKLIWKALGGWRGSLGFPNLYNRDECKVDIYNSENAQDYENRTLVAKYQIFPFT